MHWMQHKNVRWLGYYLLWEIIQGRVLWWEVIWGQTISAAIDYFTTWHFSPIYKGIFLTKYFSACLRPWSYGGLGFIPLAAQMNVLFLTEIYQSSWTIVLATGEVGRTIINVIWLGGDINFRDISLKCQTKLLLGWVELNSKPETGSTIKLGEGKD